MLRWIQESFDDLEGLIGRIKEAKAQQVTTAIGYHGNIVALWERLAEEKEELVELGSDQTSLHNPYGGGYYPVQVRFSEFYWTFRLSTARGLMQSLYLL